MLAIVLAIITLIGWGTGDIFGALNSRKIGGYSAVFWAYLIGFFLFGSIAIFRFGDLANLTPTILAISVGAALAGVIGYTLFYEALEIGNSTIAGTISSSYIVVAVPLSILFLGEKINVYQILAIILILAGVIITGIDFGEFKKRVPNKSIMLAMGAMVAWGFYFVFIKIPVTQIGWIWPNFISTAAFPLILVLMKFRGAKLELPDKEVWRNLIIAGFLLEGAYITYNAAIAMGSVAVIAPITGSSSVLFAVLSHFIFKDKITRQQILGVIITLVGIVTLSFLTV